MLAAFVGCHWVALLGLPGVPGEEAADPGLGLPAAGGGFCAPPRWCARAALLRGFGCCRGLPLPLPWDPGVFLGLPGGFAEDAAEHRSPAARTCAAGRKD